MQHDMTEQRAEKPDVYIEFFMLTQDDPAATVQAGHAVFRDVPHARWWKRGINSNSTQCPISRLPRLYPHIWHACEARYQAWSKGYDDPQEGTPLRQWPGIGRGQAETLRGLHIFTVEELAQVTDAGLDRVGMGARQLRERARAWLSAAQDTGRAAERIAQVEAENSRLKAALAQQAADVAELREALDRLQPRPGRPRGRPRKDRGEDQSPQDIPAEDDVE